MMKSLLHNLAAAVHFYRTNAVKRPERNVPTMAMKGRRQIKVLSFHTIKSQTEMIQKTFLASNTTIEYQMYDIANARRKKSASKT